MKDQLIRDHLAVGIRDRTLSECLQVEADLTLEKAKRLIRQREAVKEQGTRLKGAGSEDQTSIDSIGSWQQRGRRKHFKGDGDRRQHPTPSATEENHIQCNSVLQETSPALNRGGTSYF